MPTKLTNCMAYKPVVPSSGDKGECVACKKSYSLDKDGKCVQISVPNCSSFQAALFVLNKTLTNFLSDAGADCQKCEDTHIALNFVTFGICSRMPTLIDSSDKDLGTFVVSNTQVRDEDSNLNFIDRCVKYSLNGYCWECFTGYILDENKRVCR